MAISVITWSTLRISFQIYFCPPLFLGRILPPDSLSLSQGLSPDIKNACPKTAIPKIFARPDIAFYFKSLYQLQLIA